MEKWFLIKLKKWVASDINEPCDPDCLAEVHSWISEQLYNKNRDELRKLHTFLSPLSAKLSRTLTKKKTQLATIQAAEIPPLSAMIHSILFIMEKDDPASAVNTIRHGEEVLEVLLKTEGNVRLYEIRDQWSRNSQPPSVSTISRAVSALEEAGFIQRSGATRGRRFHILDKARRWNLSRKDPEVLHRNSGSEEIAVEGGGADSGNSALFQEMLSQIEGLGMNGLTQGASLTPVSVDNREDLHLSPYIQVGMECGNQFRELVSEAA